MVGSVGSYDLPSSVITSYSIHYTKLYEQALEIIRGLRGLNLVGADVVEVSPPYDPYGTTAVLAANLAFEMLCVMPGVVYRERESTFRSSCNVS